MDLVWWVAALSILLGNFVALSQRGLKSLLAYSSIAHAGYIAMGILARSEIGGGGEAALYYLLIYSFMTLGAFGVVLVLSAAYADKRTPDDITRFNGLATTHPWTAALMTFFMLALAGMPPAMGGFMAKFFVFTAAIKSGHVGIVLIACLGALVGAYYYLRVVVAMYFAPSAKEPRRLERDPSAYAVLALCAAAILVLGVFPQVVYVRAALAVSGM